MVPVGRIGCDGSETVPSLHQGLTHAVEAAWALVVQMKDCALGEQMERTWCRGRSLC